MVEAAPGFRPQVVVAAEPMEVVPQLEQRGHRDKVAPVDRLPDLMEPKGAEVAAGPAE